MELTSDIQRDIGWSGPSEASSATELCGPDQPNCNFADSGSSFEGYIKAKVTRQPNPWQISVEKEGVQYSLQVTADEIGPAVCSLSTSGIDTTVTISKTGNTVQLTSIHLSTAWPL